MRRCCMVGDEHSTMLVWPPIYMYKACANRLCVSVTSVDIKWIRAKNITSLGFFIFLNLWSACTNKDEETYRVAILDTAEHSFDKEHKIILKWDFADSSYAHYRPDVRLCPALPTACWQSRVPPYMQNCNCEAIELCVDLVRHQILIFLKISEVQKALSWLHEELLIPNLMFWVIRTTNKITWMFSCLKLNCRRVSAIKRLFRNWALSYFIVLFRWKLFIDLLI